MQRLVTMLVAGLLAVAAYTPASAQATGTVTGQVTDRETGQPLGSVQVFAAGTNRNALTNSDGRFVLTNVPEGERTIRAVLIGYGQEEQTVTVTAGQTATVDLALRPSAVDIDAVVVSVVTGRAERRRELGTNTASISAQDLEVAPITKMADVLVGRAAGVTMQGVAGSVGTSQRIRIRGANSISLSNEPLIFVDGIQVSNSKGGIAVGGQDYSRLNDINPEDIANIEVLKGPAASALYGTAAANGVLLITTRRGVAGRTQWRAYTEFGRSSDENDYPLNYLTVQEDDPSAPLFGDLGQINRAAYTYCPNESAARGACRQDRVVALNPFETPGLNPFGDGSRQKYGLSVAGGGDVGTYYISADYDKEQGVIEFNTQDRIALRANLNARVLDNMTVGVNAAYTRSKLVLNANDNNIFSPLINGLMASPFVPTAEQREAGSPGIRSGTGFGYYLDDIAEIATSQDVDRFMIGGNTSWEALPWLSVNANAGLDYFNRYDYETLQPGRLPIGSPYDEGYRDASRASNYIWTMSLAGVATHQVTDRISSTTTLGGQFQREQFESTGCFGAGIVEGTRSCSATSSLFSVSESFTEVRTIGGYLQQQFGLNDRLFLSASVRGDDNSAFGQDFGLILYPSASLSWVASEEPFFPELDWLSSLRLRGAIGVSGQKPGMRDAVTLLDPVAVTVAGSEASAVRLSRVGNPDLKPERTTEFEVGFDMGLFNDRLGVDFAYYHKRSKDALIARPLPPSFGLTGDATTTGSIWDNIGSIRNSGTELALNARIYESRPVSLDMRLSATTLSNEIEDMGGLQAITLNRGLQRHQEGFSAGGFWGARYEVRNTDGGLVTRDEVFMATDTAVYIGPSMPTNSQSLSADLTLFNNLVRISTLFERRAGHYQVNYTEWFRCNTAYSRGIGTGGSTGNGNCHGVADPNASEFEQARFIAGRFGPLNDEVGGARTAGVLTGYIEPADFIKWRELSVTLGMPESLIRNASALRGLSITLSGRNLTTWTDYTGIDPEINESGGGANFTQGEFNTQPPLRYYTVRVNYSF